jgi:hypothetical protein
MTTLDEARARFDAAAAEVDPQMFRHLEALCSKPVEQNSAAWSVVCAWLNEYPDGRELIESWRALRRLLN